MYNSQGRAPRLPGLSHSFVQVGDLIRLGKWPRASISRAATKSPVAPWRRPSCELLSALSVSLEISYVKHQCRMICHVAPKHCSFAPTLRAIRKYCALLAQRLSALLILLSAAPSPHVFCLSSSSFDPGPETSSGRFAGGISPPTLAADRVAPKHCSFAPTLRTIRKDCRRVSFGLETFG